MDAIKKYKSELVEIGQKAYHRGLVPATSGNISVRIPGTDKVLIKRTGVSLGDAQEKDYVLLNMDGEILEGGKPSKEVKFHIGIYKVREEITSVCHLHPPYSTAFAVAERELPVATAAAEAGLKEVPLIPYAKPGSEELAEYVVTIFRSKNIVAAMMAKHGIITVGPDLLTAYYRADLVEDTAKVALKAELLSR